ncbi:MAG: hypothetical protein O2897_02865 [bacterium]|nr:hypothetical protein [bacterium]
MIKYALIMTVVLFTLSMVGCGSADGSGDLAAPGSGGGEIGGKIGGGFIHGLTEIAGLLGGDI